MKLSDLPIGARLMYRAKEDWRTAVISRASEDFYVLIVCSPSGRSYRVKRKANLTVDVSTPIPVLRDRKPEDWKLNISKYDPRW